MGSAGLLLIGSLCSFAPPTAFIKLFQIIELMGKFYFIPVHFSPTMTTFLVFTFSLSDFINIPPSIFINIPREDVRSSYGKVTSQGQQKNPLRSSPLFATLYLFLCMMVQLLSMILNRKKHNSGYLKYFKKFRDLVFDMNVVDFMFYGFYSLMGDWTRIGLMTGLSKLLSLFILIQSTTVCLEVITASLTRKERPKYKKNLEGIDANWAHELVTEGFSKKSGHLIAPRLSNVGFFCRLICFQLVIVGLCNSSLLLICGTVLLQLTGLSLFCYSLKNKGLFKGELIAGSQKISFELGVVFFLANTIMNWAGKIASF